MCVEIVELSLLGAGAAPRVHKVTAAIDCGTAVNPGQIRAQVEGGVIMALSAALAQEITLADLVRAVKGFKIARLTQLKRADNSSAPIQRRVSWVKWGMVLSLAAVLAALGQAQVLSALVKLGN